MSSMEPRNLIIIGGACAGYTAALYAARANLAPLVISGFQSGGQLMLTTGVENYPGFPDGILGPELMQLFRKQAERFDAEILDADAEKVDFSKKPFRVWADGREYQGKTIIIATGASAKWLNVPGEEKLRGRGVSSCATCDGAFFKGKELMVVGGGDSAMEEALFLTKFATKVTIVHRRNEFRASKIMKERVFGNPKISVMWDTTVEEILGKQKVEGVRLKDIKTGKTSDFRCDGVFVAIGHEPSTSIFKGQLELDQKGYIVTKKRTMTNVEGVFAAGDVVDHRYRQAVTAAGDGCKAAMDAEKWLEEKRLVK